MPVIISRYWQNTTARERNEITRMTRSSIANASGIAATRLWIRKIELMVIAEWGAQNRITVTLIRWTADPLHRHQSCKKISGGFPDVRRAVPAGFVRLPRFARAGRNAPQARRPGVRFGR